MANAYVVYDDIKAAADEVASIKAEMDASLARAKKTIDTLIGNGFRTASASQTYEDQFVEFVTRSVTAVGALEDIVTFLNAAARAYSSADSSMAKSLDG